MNEPCPDHANICRTIGKIEASLDSIRDTYSKLEKIMSDHVAKADEPGGIRDRVNMLEATNKAIKEEISVIKQGYWKACIVSGVVGGMLARLAPDVLSDVLRYIVGVFK